MVAFKSALVLALCAVFAVASPVDVSEQALDKRQGTADIATVTCGTNKYSRKQVAEAAAEGCRLYAANQQIGTSQYPHTFNNRENLVFTTSGPYQEFPILTSGNYTGSMCSLLPFCSFLMNPTHPCPSRSTPPSYPPVLTSRAAR